MDMLYKCIFCKSFSQNLEAFDNHLKSQCREMKEWISFMETPHARFPVTRIISPPPPPPTINYLQITAFQYLDHEVEEQDSEETSMRSSLMTQSNGMRHDNGIPSEVSLGKDETLSVEQPPEDSMAPMDSDASASYEEGQSDEN